MAGQDENRRIQNIFVRPYSQLKLTVAPIIGLAMILGLIIFVMQNFSQYLETLRSTNQIDTQTIILITSHLYYYLKLTAGIAGVLLVIVLAISLMLTHRIFGPMVQINRHVEKLIKGDYTSRIQLRNYDEFRELADGLNALADDLHKKKKLAP
jgi:signal transduction histidine kinase